MSDCPQCHERLGLVRVSEAVPGTLLQHRCKAVLVILEAPYPELKVRLATPAEIGEPVVAPAGSGRRP